MTLGCHNIIIEIALMLIHVVGPGSKTFSHLSLGIPRIPPGVCPLPRPNGIGCCYRIAMQLSTDLVRLVGGWRPGSALVLLLLSLVPFVRLVATDDCSQLGAATLFLCRFLSFKQLLMLHICIIYVYIYRYIHDYIRMIMYMYTCHAICLHGHFTKGWLRGWEQPN